jgi:hypothetical protein
MAGHRIASLLKASPEGEGFHPSQTETLRTMNSGTGASTRWQFVVSPEERACA